MSSNLSHLLQHRKLSDDCGDAPRVFRISNENDSIELELLLSEHPEISIIDRIDSQLFDLVKLENPSISSKDLQHSVLISQKLDGVSKDEYGVWVYYPWKNQIVHMLDEADFIKVRTIRNAFKITLEEQAELKKKKIGVIGLSVGQSVAVALCLERICGEIRIADFDDLELSNLNRIRTGVSNIGVKKTSVVAREIAEFDPFIKITTYPEGIIEENVSSFFDDGGVLDLLIEECDSVEIKILSRQEAKKRRIPVIMDTSDKGMLDIERYDKNPQYPILHGLVDEKIDFSFLKALKTSEEKLPYILPIISTDTLSTRFKGSGLEVGKTITTWPQLASDVILGGAICANTARRILLGEEVASGRTWISLDELVPNQKIRSNLTFQTEESLSIERMDKIFLSLNPTVGEDVNIKIIEKAVKAAIQGPTAGNNQKLKWYYRAGNILLFLDKDKEYAFGDNLNIASLINAGCCVENLFQILNKEEIKFNFKTNSDQSFFPLVGIINLKEDSNSFQAIPDLSDFIYSRYTNRAKVSNRPIEESDLQKLLEIWDSSNGHLHLETSKEIISSIAKIVCQCDRFRLTNLQGHHEFFKHEIRWTREEAEAKKDGLDLSLLELSASDIAGLNIAKDITAIEFVNQFGGGSGFEKISEKSFTSNCAIGIVTAPDFKSETLISYGRKIEQIWLKATEMNLGFYPITALPMMFSFLESDKHKFNSHDQLTKLKKLKKDFDTIMPALRSDKMIFFFRIMYGEHPTSKSFRKDLNEKLIVR